MNTLKERLGVARTTTVDFLRWIILAIITGFVVGGVGILFIKVSDLQMHSAMHTRG